LLRRLLHAESDALQGQLSALYAGSELVAVHYGLRRGNVLHSWFPAYSAMYSKYSPGMEMFLQLARHAPNEGVQLLDFGYGAEPFKTKLANQCYTVKCGTVDLVPWRRTLSTWSRSARFQVKRLPWPKNMTRAVRRAALTLNQFSTGSVNPEVE
jgi:CelD/BcsL family acetyltransferase involved in cellulose biosynthesis